MFNPWVTPRVKILEPCVRGSTLTSELKGRISSSLRPSGRNCSSTIPRRTSLWSAIVNASSYSSYKSLYSSSPIFSRNASWNAQRNSFTISLRSGYGWRNLSPNLSAIHTSTSVCTSSFGSTKVYSCAAGWIFATNSFCNSIAG